MSRSRALRPVFSSAVEAPPPANSEPVVVPDSEIARRAFDLYLARGGEDGHDVEDWLEAERELRAHPVQATQ